MIRSIFLFIYNMWRIAMNKLVHWDRFDIHWLQRISPLCSLKMFQQGRMRVGRNCEFAAYCDFEAHGKGVLEIELVLMNGFLLASIVCSARA